MAAHPVAAAAVALSVPNVVCSPAITASMPVYFDSSCSLVLGTPCLEWITIAASAGGPARSCLPTFALLRAFIRRGALSSLPADLALIRTTSSLTLALTGVFWSRYLSELVDSGLVSTTLTKLRQLDEAMTNLVVTSPSNLVLSAADFLAVDPYAVAAIPAVLARAAIAGARRSAGTPARSAVPAVAAVAAVAGAGGDPDQRFLTLASIARLHSDGSPCPLTALSILAGMLGPVGTHAERADELSMVATTAVVLAQNLASYLGLDATSATPGVLAVNLRDFLLAAYRNLTPVFAAPTPSPAELTSEATDSFRFLLGSADEQTAVEARRLRFVEDLRYSPVQNRPALSPPSP